MLEAINKVPSGLVMGQLPEYLGGTSRYRGLFLVRAFAFFAPKIRST